MEVDVDGDGRAFEALTLPHSDSQTAGAEQWRTLATAYAAKFNVPVPWVLGFIYAESGGNPKVFNSCCAGLMQLSLAVYKISRDQAFDPETNIRLGVETLGHYRSKGYDLPRTASMYNAGPRQGGGPKPSIESTWGIVENRPAVPWTGYIEKVVRAANYFSQALPSPVLVPPPTQAASLPAASSPGWVAGLVAGFGAFQALLAWLRRDR